ncbi:TetR/AcrR family transcriptional regulator [Spartinivicinus poritis]|uniref:TetR/AcrR family transcriptional regulator n=1 Tax=Spartinivicinus poritis TaxID=2994640 RepID=A0ABT5UFN6_9GAMM|nr:TetR/AcrR family transcriptional regulator [Spartinivicinus sp. A2-2]MDE1465198.1 TetR/AcrR family transcriptional regulator [Spartinivicinus sp. A2-2]
MAKPKTQDKIINTSLALFNEQGERNVTTNHIASHLGISPGNLYYHFKNKQEIIYQIYLQYENDLQNILVLPQDRPITLSDKQHYLTEVVQCMWCYRFFHRDLEHLLSSDPKLHGRYKQFSRLCLQSAEAIYNALRTEGYITASDAQLKALSNHCWITMTSWVSFLRTAVLSDTNRLTKQWIHESIFQIMAIELAFFTEKALYELKTLTELTSPSLLFEAIDAV